FADRAIRDASHSGYTVIFEDGTPALPNPHNASGTGYGEEELLVSGEFEIVRITKDTSVDGSQEYTTLLVRHRADILPEITETATGPRKTFVFRKEDLPSSVRSVFDRAGEVGDVRGVPRIKPVATYDPTVGLDSLQATEKVVKSTLEGMHSLVDGIPRRIIRGLKDSGFNVKNYQGVKKLYERMENLTLDQFHQMRAPKDDALDFIPVAGFNYNETDNIIQFEIGRASCR